MIFESQAKTSDPAGWLKHQEYVFAANVRRLWLTGLAKFCVTAASFYVLASVLSNIIVEVSFPNFRDLFFLAILFSLDWLLQYIIDTRKNNLATYVQERYQGILSQYLQQRSLATIRDYSPAVWQSIFLRRIPSLQAYFSDYLPQQKLAVVIPLLVLIVVFPVSWLAAILLAVAAPLIPLFMWLVGKSAATQQQKNFIALERLSSIFLDRLSARQLLHVHDAVTRQKHVYKIAEQGVKTRTLEVLRLAFLSSSVLDFFATLGLALVAVFVGFSLLGEITFGSWQTGLTLSGGLFVLLLAPLFFNELKTLGHYYHLRAEAIGAADFIADLVDESQSYKTPLSAFSFSQMSFQLDDASGNRLVYSKSLDFRSGEKILLQGQSGSGKTTLLEALLGMRPQQNNLQTVLPWSQVAWLSQQVALTTGSVRENLTLGNVVSDEHLVKLLETVGLAEWLRHLPGGLDTLLGDYPVMSGGQQQRLAIARLLLFNKPIVCLDEPTAHLSESQAANITRILQAHLQDKTVLWVSHDLAPGDFFTTRWLINRSTGELHTLMEQKICA
ncbi:ATP-binding cassette subfamily C protein CydD [Alteromonadaceae bacterium 2753L.S.0a.02]|nr:ATP-binding cassette subfamily C protein CydD [Alteromonadaceae bacterium 2753L.S.0a.02]